MSLQLLALRLAQLLALQMPLVILLQLVQVLHHRFRYLGE
jgi:hypothetical protein